MTIASILIILCGAIGAAAQALPSAPAGYLLAWINGAQRRIPYY